MFDPLKTVVGPALDFLGGERKMDFEEQEAQKQRDYQSDMSNTAVQRKMADMRSGGINPMLAASSGGMSGGASTPTGAKGAGHAVQYATSALAIKKHLAEIDNLKQDKTRIWMDTEKKTAETELLRTKKKLEDTFLAGRTAERDIDKSWYGKGLRWINRVPMPLVPKLNMKGR